MTDKTPSLVMLISGRGSNMEAFIRAIAEGALDARIAGVISNVAGAPGLDLARQANLPTRVLPHGDYPDRESFDAALGNEVASNKPDLVILAGFMRILTPEFVDRFAGMLLNIHPSLLPKYPGLNTHQRAIDAGDAEAGATVHYVTGELDGGPAIMQVRLPIQPEDTADSLAQRLLPLEHQLYPAAAKLHLSGKLTLTNGTLVLDGKTIPPTGLEWSPQ
jgi:phosphoribosylglycinamide formyltransferase-1